MKFVYVLLICCCYMAVAMAQLKIGKKTEVTASGGGGSKQGIDYKVDVKRNIWQSQNKRHSVDATGGVSQHLGGPYGNSNPNYRIGAGYTFRF